ncbi:TPA: hypothetical protein DEO28_04285 [Candidatus Dependentiae bacterium]|nr:MAG: hypothetical protein UR14_C0006G0094 [candidate division TM6 bacterium GW2011_GWE2_31_21]KKP53483.1 MAG: hypothetical protein UR43_C0004G0024 [candidate division TM6 bacterium GW2011_GWF2_33_332]HBS48275.1 hypothetical protein [Candidatus Dependentiae bacterium]HBZ73702.1 hypothetical protein [Candidatus Dependentiae bacterium]
MIRVKNLTIKSTNASNQEEIIKNLSFVAKKGSLTAFCGTNSSGKTTILRSLGGLENHYEGSIEIDKQEIKDIKPEDVTNLVGVVFQNFNLFPHLTGIDNCIQPLILSQKMNLEEAKEIVFKIFADLKIEELARMNYSELSEIQKQKICIARALNSNPKVLILDEPFSSLTQDEIKELILWLKNLSKKVITLVISHHSTEIITEHFNHIHQINNGEIIESTNK